MQQPSAEDLTAALRGYSDRRDASIAAARRKLGIGDVAARALLFVATRRLPVRAGEIAEQLGISSAGVTSVLDRLEQMGAVRRIADVSDRRIVRIEAAIDLDDEPWSELIAFDRAAAVAVADASGRYAIGYVLQVLGRITDRWDREHLGS